uniref:Uncharacterized protein n=1 Tax=Aegilops tauschii subsp. strangulata TaxID=200361 RepID=A0A453I408_AEGTS
PPAAQTLAQIDPPVAPFPLPIHSSPRRRRPPPDPLLSPRGNPSSPTSPPPPAPQLKLGAPPHRRIRTSSPTTWFHGKVSTSSAAPLCIDYGHQFKLGAPTSPDLSFFPVGRRVPSAVDPRHHRCSDISGLPELVIRTAVSFSVGPPVWPPRSVAVCCLRSPRPPWPKLRVRARPHAPVAYSRDLAPVPAVLRLLPPARRPCPARAGAPP